MRKIQWELVSGQVVEAALITLFFMVPLAVLPTTYELFEFNKIILVYALAAIIASFELIRLVAAKRPRIARPHLLVVGLIFIAALTISTLTSIDRQVSLFGYYGRFHGGLLSIISYGVIYFSLTQLPAGSYLNLIKVSLFSGFLVAGWGFLQHWGIDASYWAQDVKARVFSTLGHPNWLGAYLAMLIPWTITFYLLAKTRPLVVLFGALTLLFYTTFVFTYSRGASVGLAVGIAVFFGLVGMTILKASWRRFLLVLIGMAAITLTFASPWTTQIAGTAPYRTVGAPAASLESGNETGNIRLIVWQGAFEVFKHYPILGSGPETFGESFYQFRPVEMNYTGEWNYLFNKAHNEYLNFLATTGILGTAAYASLLIYFFWLISKEIFKASLEKRLYLAAATAGTAAYLIQNIFGFTVVPLATLLLLNLAALILTKVEVRSIKLKVSQSLAPLVLLPLVLLLLGVFNLWRADAYYTQGLGAFDLGANEEAEGLLVEANKLNPTEPDYTIQLAYVRAYLAQDKSSLELADSAQALADSATAISPFKLSIWRIKGQIMEELIEVDSKFKDQARAAKERAVQIAPTEAEVRLELAQFYEATSEGDLALATYLQTLGLKNDLLEALISCTRLYLERGDLKQAKIYLSRAQKIDPDDPAVVNLSQKVFP